MPDLNSVALPVFQGLDRFAAGLARGFTERNRIRAAREQRQAEQQRMEMQARAKQARDRAALARKQRERAAKLYSDLLGRYKTTGRRGVDARIAGMPEPDRAKLQEEFTRERVELMRNALAAAGKDIDTTDASQLEAYLKAYGPPVLETEQQTRARLLRQQYGEPRTLTPAQQLAGQMAYARTPEFRNAYMNYARVHGIDPALARDILSAGTQAPPTAAAAPGASGPVAAAAPGASGPVAAPSPAPAPPVGLGPGDSAARTAELMSAVGIEPTPPAIPPPMLAPQPQGPFAAGYPGDAPAAMVVPELLRQLPPDQANAMVQEIMASPQARAQLVELLRTEQAQGEAQDARMREVAEMLGLYQGQQDERTLFERMLDEQYDTGRR